MHILDFGTHFFTAVDAFSLQDHPRAFDDFIMFKQSSLHFSYPLLC